MAKQAFKVRFKGLKKLQKNLRTLPPKIQRKVIRKALNKAANPVLKDARRRCPLGTGLTPDGRERKHLKRNIVKTRVRFNKRTGAGYVVIGPRAQATPHSHLVHDGTAPHEITLTKLLVLQNTVLPAGFVIQHPGSKPQPFLADAVESQAGNAQKVLQTEIRKGIALEASKLKGGA